jgi:putative hydrolase of the HAD superfamily
MTLEYALFDLDETLYAREIRLGQTIDERCTLFLVEALGLTFEAADEKRLYYNHMYGTVLRGLLQEEAVDIITYLTFVHDVAVQNFLGPSPALAEMLSKIPLRKFIFTNSYHKHAENVMAALGVTEQFDGIFDIQSVDFVSKPSRYSYTTVVRLLDTVPEQCVFIDDQVRNMKEPKLMGMKTILIDDQPSEWVDIRVNHILEVGEAIEQLICDDRP